MNKSVARGIALALLSATSFYAAADAHLIRVGFNPGPYKEQFEKGVAPYLLSKGYKIEYKDFSDGIQVNDAVARGDIEANIMQHPVYLKAINERLGIDNVGIVQVPTPPMGLYGGKLTTGTRRRAPSCRYQTSRQMNIARYWCWRALAG